MSWWDCLMNAIIDWIEGDVPIIVIGAEGRP